MQGGEAAEGVAHHRSTLNPYRVEKRADEAGGEGWGVIGGLKTTIVSGQVYRVDEVVACQIGQYPGPLPCACAHAVQ